MFLHAVRLRRQLNLHSILKIIVFQLHLHLRCSFAHTLNTHAVKCRSDMLQAPGIHQQSCHDERRV